MKAAIVACLAITAGLAQAPAARAQTPEASPERQQAQATAPATLAGILAQQREIQAALQRNDSRFAHLDAFRRSRIKQNQETVFRRAAGYRTMEEMKADDQLALFNALKRIESLLIQRDEDDHMVCERVAIVGTRRYEMACMTRAERDERAEGAKKALLERQACTTSGCIGD